MTTLFVSEYTNVEDGIPVVPPIAEQTVAYGPGESPAVGVSAAFNDKTNYVEVVSLNDARLEWGTSPSASASSPLLTAGSRKLVRVPNGEGFKVSAAYI